MVITWSPLAVKFKSNMENNISAEINLRSRYQIRGNFAHTGVQLKEQPGWFHPPCTSHCLLYKCTVSEIPEPSYFYEHLSGRSLSQAGVCHACSNLDAGIWILDPRCTYWIAHGNFHSRYPCLSFVYLRLFQGLWLAISLRVARGADLINTGNPKGEVVRLAVWLLTLGAQDALYT
jgi:hypothetical protein